MHKLTFLFLLLAQAPIALTAELVTKIAWDDAAKQGILIGGEVSESGVLEITGNSQGQLVQIIEFDRPGITQPVYALKGMIRYSDVTGEAYLQLDNYFSNRGVFFTKGIAPDGPLQVISGNSDWRAFVLPFFANTGASNGGAIMLPDKLSLSVYIPDSGTVSLNDVALYQYSAGENPLHGAALGVGNYSFGLLGAVGGSLMGLWGAGLGWLSSVGRGRVFVIGSLNLFGFIGAASLVGGMAAIAAGRSTQLIFTLLVIGISLLAALALRRSVRARYEALELRKMTSIDTQI